ncbi:acylphosphatase [Desulfosarcina widdelii]|uniref:Acylphosphatase n=1 Tax=Desulfosarcina widdelii TaxID=947919 RepID=A0A5K7YX31_9BACT|nr:acylphosphatase [Desulfosarcina widdelii]BBO73896.1 acylphosphatase [Desulfosarcina widdelii]
MEDNAKAHLIISGKVQGVYFRAETQRAALRLGVTGWVRNKRDGTVEADVEGAKKNVMALIDWCKSGSPLSRVDRVDVRWENYQGSLDTFEVRF